MLWVDPPFTLNFPVSNVVELRGRGAGAGGAPAVARARRRIAARGGRHEGCRADGGPTDAYVGRRTEVRLLLNERLPEHRGYRV